MPGLNIGIIKTVGRYPGTWKGGMADEEIIIGQNCNSVFGNLDVVGLSLGAL